MHRAHLHPLNLALRLVALLQMVADLHLRALQKKKAMITCQSMINSHNGNK